MNTPQNFTPHMLKDIFVPKYTHLMACKEYRKAKSFCTDTKQIAMDAFGFKNEKAAALRAYLDKCHLMAEMASYNDKWELDLEETTRVPLQITA